MTGHSNKKGGTDKNTHSSNVDNILNNVHLRDGQQQQSLIDIDELAREKVSQIESIICETVGSSKNFSIETLDDSLAVLRQIITAADLHRTNDKNQTSGSDQIKPNDLGESIYADYSDDNEQFNAHEDLSEQFATNSVKWTIRVQAFKLVHQLVRLFTESANSVTSSKSNLLKNLSDLIRLSFVSATSPYDELKMQGFEMFLNLIDKLAYVEEKDFVGHSILEQYKTQVLSAVKPAFNSDAPPYITAIASQICSLWICKGLEKDPIDIKRTHQLILLSIEKLESQSINQNSKLYTESELEQERLGILDSWAQLYLASKEVELLQSGRTFRLSQEQCANLYSLVAPQLDILVDKWWEALKDYALLIMPAPRLPNVSPHDNGNVYTREVALELFEKTWPKLILASSIWLCLESGILEEPTPLLSKGSASNQYDCDKKDESPKLGQKRASSLKYTKFICGIIMKEFCRRHIAAERLPDSTIYSLRALHLLLSTEQTKLVLVNDMEIAKEFYTVLYNITTSYGRDPNRALLVANLDLMLSLIIDELLLRDNVSALRFGLVKLVGQLMNAMKEIEFVSKHGDNDATSLDVARMHLSIRFNSLLILIKKAPKQTLGELELLEAVLVVFQEALSFDFEPNFLIGSAEKLNELCPLIPVEVRVYFLTNIIKELSSKISQILRKLYDNTTDKEEDKKHLSIWDAFTKCIRISLQHIGQQDQPPLVEFHVRSLTENIDLEDLVNSKRKMDLLNVIVGHLNALTKCLGSESVNLISDEVKQKLEAVLKSHSDMKSKMETKLALKKSTKAAKESMASTRPQKTTITLKADFSNFYTKK